MLNKYRLLLFSLLVEAFICIQITGYIWWEKAQSAHIITFDFYFHQEHSKAHLHSCHIHTGVLFHSRPLFTLSVPLFPFLPPSPSLSFFFFSISPFLDLSFMSLH